MRAAGILLPGLVVASGFAAGTPSAARPFWRGGRSLEAAPDGQARRSRIGVSQVRRQVNAALKGPRHDDRRTTTIVGRPFQGRLSV